MNPLGFLKSMVNPITIMQLAMGPAGWASIVIKAAVSAVGQQVIQQLGEKLGLPQPVIDVAKGALASATGTQGLPNNIGGLVQMLAQQNNLSPVQQGNLQRTLEGILDQITTATATSREFKEAQATGGKSWLMAIAEALGRTADKLATEMDQMASDLGNSTDKTRASDNIKFGAKTQEFGQFFNSANTVIKALGEALSAGARKQ